MDKILDTAPEVSEFELQSCSFIHARTYTFGKSKNHLIPLAMDKIVPLLFFYNDGFDIE